MNRLSHRFVRVGLALAGIMFLGQAATAAPVTYFGADDPKGTLTNSFQARDNFQNALSSYGVDTLEAYDSIKLVPKLTFAPLTITAIADTSFIAPVFPISGIKALLDRGPPAQGGTPFDDSFLISEPVTAFGLFISNAGDAFTNTFTLLLENTLVGPSANRTVNVVTIQAKASSTNAFFIGVTDTVPFNKISIHETEDYDGTLYDNITVGFVVPEPSSFALASLGGCALLWFARRRSDPRNA